MPDLGEEAAPFFRDVLDHLARTAEEADSLDALLSTAFDAHVARISMQQNDDMRDETAHRVRSNPSRTNYRFISMDNYR